MAVRWLDCSHWPDLALVWLLFHLQPLISNHIPCVTACNNISFTCISSCFFSLLSIGSVVCIRSCKDVAYSFEEVSMPVLIIFVDHRLAFRLVFK